MKEELDLFGQRRTQSVEKTPLPTPGAPPPKRIKPIDRSQCFWGAVDIEKLIEQDHPARGIWAMVQRLDLGRLEDKIKAVEGRAGQAHLDPRLLMALWIYGISEGVNSARELSRMCDDEPGCRWLTGLQPINYHTLSDFRLAHKQDLDEVFVQVLGLLSAEGLIEMKRITQDGTKIKACAAAGSFRRQDRIGQHLVLARQQVEHLEAPESGPLNQRMIEARKRARQEKKHRLEEALSELEQIQKTRAESEKDRVRVSETDPQARVMKQSDGGFAPSYNVQISTDAAQGIIVAVDVTPAGNDCDQLVPAIDHVEANTGKTPEQVLTDGGYSMKNTNIEAMAERGIDLIAPVVENTSEASLKQRGIEPEFYPDKFPYDAATDTMSCPAGNILKLSRTYPAEGRTEYTYSASPAACAACRFRPQCCPKSSARSVLRKQHSPAVLAFRARMQGEEAQQIYRSRSQIAEFPHAWIKDKFGIRQFRLRGLKKVGIEAMLACLTYNICQWLRLAWRPALVTAA
jgi:transposase